LPPILITDLAMKVFNFGGASINSVERIKNLGDILKNHKDEKMLVVISAMGKTTNALEKVVDAFLQAKKKKLSGYLNR